MKSSELRIGNYLYDRNDKLAIVEEINEDDFKAYSGMATSLLLKPIPLTKEWLMNLGYFPCSFSENHYSIIGHRVWQCNEMFLCDKNGVIIKHVHQLQNLYFALTGEELTIKN